MPQARTSRRRQGRCGGSSPRNGGSRSAPRRRTTGFGADSQGFPRFGDHDRRTRTASLRSSPTHDVPLPPRRRPPARRGSAPGVVQLRRGRELRHLRHRCPLDDHRHLDVHDRGDRIRSRCRTGGRGDRDRDRLRRRLADRDPRPVPPRVRRDRSRPGGRAAPPRGLPDGRLVHGSQLRPGPGRPGDRRRRGQLPPLG